MAMLRDRSALPPLEVSHRLKRLQENLAEPAGSTGGEDGCDSLLVTSLPNIRYLTGFAGSAGMLLVTAKEAVLGVDSRYDEQARLQAEVAGGEVEIETARGEEQLRRLVRRASGCRRLGLEADVATWALKRRVSEAVGALPRERPDVVAAEPIIERLRCVKDEAELARIEMAADIADVALAQVKERLEEEMREVDFAIELDFEMRRRGADDVSFPTIVGSGPNGAHPHAVPSDRAMQSGEAIVVDFGAAVDGYRSDMTRTLSLGGLSPEFADVVDAVMLSQRAGVRALRAGAEAAEADRACRESLEEAGYGDRFVHGTGHGVGLEIHEAPAVSSTSTDILQAGVVVTIEPGVYLTGAGGVRIEDTLVVTETGARALTKSTKDTTI
jgi:Xaa-Pro aminopeptidase